MSDNNLPPRKSLVDYSKITNRPVRDARFEHPSRVSGVVAGPAVAPTAAAAMPLPLSSSSAAAAMPARMSAQMDAVVRLMTGHGERTIAEKLADSNRPTWEQYKKENQSKLNLDEGQENEMENYRRQLDEQRERLLARGGTTMNKPKKKKKRKRKGSSDDDNGDDNRSTSVSVEGSSDDDEDSREKNRGKRHKKSHKKKKRRKHDNDSDSHDNSSSYDRRQRKKRHKRKKKKKKETDDADSDGSHYKLSKFFSQGTENNS